MKHIITSDQIDQLHNMLMGGKEDVALTMNILNNRDIKNEESEKNILKLTEMYLHSTMPGLKRQIDHLNSMSMLCLMVTRKQALDFYFIYNPIRTWI